VFAEWLSREVDRLLSCCCELPDMVKESAKLLSHEATAFCAMKAHRMHLRLRSVEEDKVSDNSMAATFLQP
jgi:hypothetical protein